MKLFEITNGFIGEAYVRCYVWAETVEQALAMALSAYQKQYKTDRETNDLRVEELFDEKADPFVTIPSDWGWVTE